VTAFLSCFTQYGIKMNNYYFTHILDSETILVACRAGSLAEASKRLSKALSGSPMLYCGSTQSALPKIGLDDVTQRSDPVYREH